MFRHWWKIWCCCPFFLGHQWRLGAVPSDLSATHILSYQTSLNSLLCAPANTPQLSHLLTNCVSFFFFSPHGCIVLKLFQPFLLGTYIWVCGNEKCLCVDQHASKISSPGCLLLSQRWDVQEGLIKITALQNIPCLSLPFRRKREGSSSNDSGKDIKFSPDNEATFCWCLLSIFLAYC